jgi:hypothetical protein
MLRLITRRRALADPGRKFFSERESERLIFLDSCVIVPDQLGLLVTNDDTPCTTIESTVFFSDDCTLLDVILLPLFILFLITLP